MAHFIAEIQGCRGPASRLGSKSSGISATINGWEIGCHVYIEHDESLDEDIVIIEKTGGSNHSNIRAETLRWMRPVDHSRLESSKCPIDANNQYTQETPSICNSRVKKNRKGNTWKCTRPQNHEGPHHNHTYGGTCNKTWTTEEAVIDAL